MTVNTVRDICTKAYVKLGVVRAGDAPGAADMASALASLESWYAEAISQGSFGRVTSVIQTTDVTASPGQHINNLTGDPLTVTLPDQIESWWWAEGRVPADLSVVVTTNLTSVRKTYIYDGQIQRWVSTTDLILNDEAPLSSRGPDGLASLLAVRLSDEYGADLLSPLTMQSANRYKLALVSRHGTNDCPEWDRGYDYEYNRPGGYY